WLELVAASGLSGPSRQLAANAAFISFQHGVLKLGLSPGFEYLSSERALGALSEMLGKALGSPPKIVVDATQAPAETLHQRSDRQRGERQQAAEAFFMADPEVQVLIQQHGARLVSDSIRPFEE
ncbi:MAG: DNA polymerase III subunit gamma/tau C-terminal domain-containing protein, partial [Stenotrophomonas chelatiphaga]